MRGFIAATLLLASMVAIAPAQGMPDMTPPAEMKATDFLLGNFKGTANFYRGTEKTAAACSFKSERALNDRFVRMAISYQMKMQGMPDMNTEGMEMLTYDPAAKQYAIWWFDGLASTAMHFTGNFDGEKLVFLSDASPVESGGAPGVSRFTWWKNGDALDCSLEMKQGDKWVPFMDAEFHKA